MTRRHRLSAPEELGTLIVRGEVVRAASSSRLGAPKAIDAVPVAPRDWELAVGTKIARRARPTRLERGVLHIRTASSTWAQELSLLADAIAEQLRARGLDVRSLRFHVGPVEPLKRPSWRTDVRTSPEPVKLPAEVKASLAKVEDSDLRTAIARAAAASLGYEAAPAPAPPALRPRPRAAPAPAPPPPAPAPSQAARAADSRNEAARGAAERRGAEPKGPATSPRSSAPAPRSAGARSAPPDRTSAERRAAPRGTRGGPSARGS